MELTGQGAPANQVANLFGKAANDPTALQNQQATTSQSRAELNRAKLGKVEPEIRRIEQQTKTDIERENALRRTTGTGTVTETARSASMGGEFQHDVMTTRIEEFFSLNEDKLRKDKVPDKEIIRLINEKVKNDGMRLPPDANVTFKEPGLSFGGIGGFGSFDLGGGYDIESIVNQLERIPPSSTSRSIRGRLPAGQPATATAPVPPTPPTSPVAPVAPATVKSPYDIESSIPGLSQGEANEMSSEILEDMLEPEERR